MPSIETVLSVIPCQNDSERILVVRCQSQGESRMELRQQSWGDGLGWFTQSSVAVEPQQLQLLRLALGGSYRSPTMSRRHAHGTERGFVPRVVHAESA